MKAARSSSYINIVTASSMNGTRVDETIQEINFTFTRYSKHIAANEGNRFALFNMQGNVGELPIHFIRVQFTGP